jgi:hypothetical protein
MLRAVVRSGREAIHFIGDLNGYNLQTLQLHARGARRDGAAVRVEVELDDGDAALWRRYARTWLQRMRRAGVTVFVRGEGAARGAVEFAEGAPAAPPWRTSAG